jgi:hypothetical protein
MLASACPGVELPTLNESASALDTQLAWQQLWSAVGARLLEHLEAGHGSKFESAFPTIHDALAICAPVGRQAAVAALFGDLARRAIASGFDRTRFREWFGPDILFTAAPGRMRGRVLYFKNEKGHGKVLGADRLTGQRDRVNGGTSRSADWSPEDPGESLVQTAAPTRLGRWS